MNPAYVARHLERGEAAKDTNTVKTIKYLPFQLYFERWRHLCNLVCHFIIVLLGPFRQAMGTDSTGLSSSAR